MSERIGEEVREWEGREGGRRSTLQTLVRCHCSAARGQRQQRWERVRWRRTTVPSICGSVPITDRPPSGTSPPSWEQNYTLPFTRTQVLDPLKLPQDHHSHPFSLSPTLSITSSPAEARRTSRSFPDFMCFGSSLSSPPFADLWSWVDLLLSCGGPWGWGGGVQEGPSVKGQGRAFWWHCCCSVVSGRCTRRQMMGSLSTSGKQVLLNH